VNRDLLITRVARVDARCEAKAWSWAEENRAAIDRNWATRTADKPKMFNGRVLLIADMALEEEACRATYFETNFADFLGWRDLGYPDRTIANGFAMGALQGSDGAYICGVMGGHTANAGRIYFPSGTPDRSDLRPDGSVDLATSVTRELKEETSLPSDSYEVADSWIVVRQWPSVAFLRPITFAEPAEAVAERIRANIARQSDPELSDVRVIRGPDDVDPHVMPLFLQSFFRAAFDGQR
jgi:8-oxo-dGTP pyrophosphatase MutT (NUDIX family)